MKTLRIAYLVCALISLSKGLGLDFGFVLLSQDFDYDAASAQLAREDLIKQARALKKAVDVVLTHEAFPDVEGAWAFWPIIQQLKQRYDSTGTPKWLLIGESFTQFNLRLLDSLLREAEPNAELIGRGLVDNEPTIIHHFHGFDRDRSSPPFMYFDFSSGVAIKDSLLEKIFAVPLDSYPSGFTIDAKFELTKFINDTTGVTLKSSKSFCYQQDSECVTWFSQNRPAQCRPEGSVHKENVFFAVKTFSGFHKTRVVVVKRTWARTAKLVEFFSDSEDPYVPTIDLNVENTKRGHCEKTLRILRHYIEHKELREVPWVVIADDDTLLGVERVYRLLECVDARKPVIVGEKYGYGFSPDGRGGYSYPTGGSGMVFSRSAATLLASKCDCPSIDSPDDMILGICAKRFNIPIYHSAAFHQARSRDYPAEYLTKLPTISLHKFEDIDPYKDYMDLLHTPMNRHEEL